MLGKNPETQDIVSIRITLLLYEVGKFDLGQFKIINPSWKYKGRIFFETDLYAVAVDIQRCPSCP